MAKLFGSSGLRGLVNADLTPTLAVRVGMAVGTFNKAGRVFVARDTRTSGLMLENALVSGLLACGAKVCCFDVLPTPVLAYLTGRLGADAGVMITASHNPPQYNGIKVFDGSGMAYNEKSQGEIEKIIKESNFKLARWQDVSKAEHGDEGGVYLEMVQKSVRLKKKWRVAVDPGCGATSRLAPAVFKSLNCDVIAVNAQPDGFFPARSSEPNAESLMPLARIVKALKADVGIAYDGDGDRAAFIDEKGGFVDFDRVLAAYAAYIMRKKRGETVVTNVEASMCIEKMVESYGGKVVRTRVGDVYVAEAVKKFDAVFGGEPCGAWIHPQHHYCPDGMLSSALLLKALEDENRSLSEFIAEVPAYNVVRKNVPCKSIEKHAVVKKAGKLLQASFPKYKEFSEVDGARLVLDDGWVLVRASGTEPLIRLTVEGESLKVANKIMEKAASLVEKVVEGYVK
ncbi:phosphoglucosamine mutase [Candidatus Bathyarchaeota archaeon]|nr:phosphoglucosamine mutase [Candidatus Bathyarchaeota archaeon]